MAGDSDIDLPSKSWVLLLTATIDPGGTVMVARNDPAQRLSDYQEALTSWVRSGTFKKIVLFENSGYPIAALRKAVELDDPDVELEFLSIPMNEWGEKKGKGYSELIGILKCLDESRLLKSAGMIVKCTGRLSLLNAVNAVGAMQTVNCEVMCNLKRYLTFADSRMFAATPNFIRNHLGPQLPMIDDLNGVFFEHALACAVASCLAVRQLWRPFPFELHFVGISGTHNTRMTDRLPIRALKSAFRKLRNFAYSR